MEEFDSSDVEAAILTTSASRCRVITNLGCEHLNDSGEIKLTFGGRVANLSCRQALSATTTASEASSVVKPASRLGAGWLFSDEAK